MRQEIKTALLLLCAEESAIRAYNRSSDALNDIQRAKKEFFESLPREIRDEVEKIVEAARSEERLMKLDSEIIDKLQ